MDARLETDKPEYGDLLEDIPMHRTAKPGEIATMCAFLASEGVSYSTGSTFFVDGGTIRAYETIFTRTAAFRSNAKVAVSASSNSRRIDRSQP